MRGMTRTAHPGHPCSGPLRQGAASALLLALASPAAHAACGLIPADHPVYAGGSLSVDRFVDVNGGFVSRGKTGPGSHLTLTGQRGSGAVPLPDLDPSEFPDNPSTVDRGHSDAPFVSTGEVYYDDVSVGAGRSVSFSGGGVFHVDRLRVGEQATLRMAAGTYYVDELRMDDLSNLVVDGGGPVVLHIGSRFEVEDRVDINRGGSVTGLQVMLHDGSEFRSDDFLDFAGILYGPEADRVEIDRFADVEGLIAIGGDVEFDDLAELNLDAGELAAIGQVSTCSSVTPEEPALLAHYAMEEDAWTGAAGEVADETGSYAAAARNGADTASSFPAVAGSPGSCRYAVFDGNDDHLALPADFPNLTGSFTVSAWIRADSVSGDNRIVADDASNSGGWGFSLGDQGQPGKLRFFSRGVSPVSVDTRSAVISAGTWYFVTAVHDAATRTRRIYVDASPVTLDSGGTTATYRGSWSTDTGRAGIGGEVDSSTGEATARWRFDGAIDEVRIHTGALTQAEIAALMATTRPCDIGPDHFAVVHDGDAVNCAVEPVTITAHDDAHGVVEDYTGTVNLSTSTGNGDWSLVSGAGTLVNAGGGSASYTFAGSDAGTVTLGLRDPVVESVDIDVEDAGVAESPAEDPPLAFAAAGFRFLADGVPSAIGTQIAGKPSDVAPAAQVIELQAIRTDAETGACEAALSGSVSVQMALECRNTATCAVAMAAVNGVAVPANDAAGVIAWAALDLDFGDETDGTATLVLTHADAGAVRWHARHELADAAGNPTGERLAGTAILSPRDVLDIHYDTVNPARREIVRLGLHLRATDPDAVSEAAGRALDVLIAAVAWQAGDDADADGLPDTGANLHDNARTPGFGAESTVQAVAFTSSLVAPAGGDPGALTGGLTGGFAAGTADGSLVFSEVGIIDVTATLADYLGGGAPVTGTAPGVGRFHPARLDWADDSPAFRDGPDAGWGCGFTWMDQPFAFAADPVFSVTARNAAGAVTRNYAGDFFKLGPAPFLAGRSYASTAVGGSSLDAPGIGSVTLSGEDDFDGVAALTLTGEVFAYRRGTAPVAPFDAEVDLTLAAADLSDTDGVCYTAAGSACRTGAGDTPEHYRVEDIGGASLRFGRLAMRNAGGSELMPLSLPVRTEYHDGSGFVPAADDDCSSLPAASLDLANDGDDPLTGVAVIAVGAGSSTAALANDPLVDGDAGLTLGAPGAGNTGYVEVRVDLSVAGAEWLRHDWDGDGDHDDDPVARASFGIHDGSPHLIDLREPWN